MKRTIQIILDSTGWILEVLANQCYEELKAENGEFEVSLKVGKGDPGKDIYIHFIYLNAHIMPSATNIVYVTHVDRWHKAFRLVRLAHAGAHFVTMSVATRYLVSRYTGVNSITTQVPKSIHFNQDQTARCATFGIFSNLYPDQRKGDQAIKSFLSIIEKYPNAQAILMGSGYENVLSTISESSYSYIKGEFNLENYRESLDKCDYVLYFGKDEGAISILDAATLNKPVIAIDQGYHSDISLPFYSRLCQSSDEMIETIENICQANNKHHQYVDWQRIIDGVVVDNAQDKSSLLRLLLIPFVKNEFSIEGSVRMRKLTSKIYRFFNLSS